MKTNQTIRALMTAVLVAFTALSITACGAKGDGLTLDNPSIKMANTPRMQKTQSVEAYTKSFCGELEKGWVCEVFATVDGDLSGYLALVKYGDSKIAPMYFSELYTTKGKKCDLLGDIYYGQDFRNPMLDTEKDFKGAQSVFTSPQGSDGYIYLKREGKKLELHDETWNECYSDQHLEVNFVRIAKLTK